MSASLLILAAAVDLATACKGRDGWADPAPPARIAEGVYDVGTCGITVVLVTTPAGHVLIDAGPVEAAPLVAANVERLGYKLTDVRYILSGHEHHDHAGGFAELLRRTGATLIVGERSRASIESGTLAPTDPQWASSKPFARARVGWTLPDGGRLAIGGVTFTAVATPGHSPGATSWTWASCEAGACRTIVYADSLTAVSAPTYRFRDHPDAVATLRGSIARVRELKCDLLITPHPGASNLFPRLSGSAPLVDPEGCSRYADAASAALDARLAKESRR
jgi:metallo-beta-lactamase class B